MIELILILTVYPQAAPYRPQALPWTPMQIIKVPVTAEVKREPTDAEKDAAYLKENHWRLGPSSCSMLNCPIHRVWELVPGSAPATASKEIQDATPVTTDGSIGPGAGCPNGQCQPRFRLFRRR